MKCKKCGATYPDEIAFCWRCRTPRGADGLEEKKRDPNAVEWGWAIGGTLIFLTIETILILIWVGYNNCLPFLVFGAPLIIAGVWGARWMQVIVRIVLFLAILFFFAVVWVIGRAMWPPSTW